MLYNSPKLLIIDDDEFFLSTLAAMVEDLGYTIAQTCSTYKTALQAINTGDFDLVLLDISLNSTTESEEGIALGSILYQLKKPFIYVTGLCNIDSVKRATQTYPTAYLSKPLTEAQLFSAIQISFQNHKRSASKKTDNSPQEFFFVKIGRDMQRIDWASVYGLRAISNYVEVLCNDRPVAVPVRGTLKTFLQTKVPANYQDIFIQINRSELLHREIIKGVEGKEVLTPHGTFVTTRGRFLRDMLLN